MRNMTLRQVDQAKKLSDLPTIVLQKEFTTILNEQGAKAIETINNLFANSDQEIKTSFTNAFYDNNYSGLSFHTINHEEEDGIVKSIIVAEADFLIDGTVENINVQHYVLTATYPYDEEEEYTPFDYLCHYYYFEDNIDYDYSIEAYYYSDLADGSHSQDHKNKLQFIDLINNPGEDYYRQRSIDSTTPEDKA